MKKKFTKVTNEPLLHVLVIVMSHRTKCESSGGGGFFHSIPFSFPSPGLQWFLQIWIKSLPESPTLTQLPAVLRGWIEFLGCPGESPLRAVCSQSPNQWSFMKGGPFLWFFGSSWDHGYMRNLGYEVIIRCQPHPWRKKTMSTSLIVPLYIEFH